MISRRLQPRMVRLESNPNPAQNSNTTACQPARIHRMASHPLKVDLLELSSLCSNSMAMPCRGAVLHFPANKHGLKACNSPPGTISRKAALPNNSSSSNKRTLCNVSNRFCSSNSRHNRQQLRLRLRNLASRSKMINPTTAKRTALVMTYNNGEQCSPSDVQQLPSRFSMLTT